MDIKKWIADAKYIHAYEHLLTALAADPADKKTVNNLALVCYRIFEHFREIPAEKIIQVARNLQQLDFSLLRPAVPDRYAYQLSDIIHHWASERYDDMCQLIFSSPYEVWQTGPGFSRLYRTILRVMKDDDRLGLVIEQLGFDRFSDEDFTAAKMKNGRSAMSLVELVIIRYTKYLLTAGLLEETDEEVKRKVLEWIQRICTLERPGMKWPPYSKAKLYIRIKEFSKAFQVLKPFALRHQSEFWVWSLLSEMFPDDLNTKKACLARALLCPKSDKFKIGVMEDLFDIHVQEEENALAAYLLAKILKIREENGWHVPSRYVEFQLFGLPDTKADPAKAEAYYRHWAARSLDILTGDLPGEEAVITKLNPAAGWAYYFINYKDIGRFKYAALGCQIRPGDTVLLKRIKSAKRVEVVGCLSDDFDFEYRRRVKLKAHFGDKTYAIIKSVFVHRSLIPDPGQCFLLEGIAVPALDKTKKQWGWRLARVDKATPCPA